MPQLTPLAPDIWTHSAPLRLLGLNIQTRLTLLRGADGGLLVHSPTPLTAALAAEVDALGVVRHLVAPSLFHHLYLQEWAARYPRAARWAPRALAAKRPDLNELRPLEDLGDGGRAEGWPEGLTAHLLAGAPKADEHAFVHAPSGTLVLTDALFYLPAARGLWTRLYALLNGCVAAPRQTALFRALVRDRAAFTASMTAALDAAPISRVSLCHSEVWEAPPGRVREALLR